MKMKGCFFVESLMKIFFCEESISRKSPLVSMEIITITNKD